MKRELNKEKPLSKRKTEAARNPWSHSSWWVWMSMVEKIFGKDMFLA